VDDSETGSESGFQTAPTDPVESRGTSHVTTLVYDSSEEEEEDYNSDNSVDLLQPTQVETVSTSSKLQYFTIFPWGGMLVFIFTCERLVLLPHTNP
jgi:hypothetical protein